MKKVLYIATSSKTRGGITSVINTYKQCSFWKKYKIRWISTHIDKNKIIKILYFFKGLIHFFIIIWFYDIVHFHVGELASCRRKFIFFKITRILRKKTIIHFHIGTQISMMSENTICKNMVYNADSIIVLSNEIKRTIVQIFTIKENNVTVIYNTIKPIEKLIYNDKNKIILYAGKLNTNKGYDILLKAFALIAKKYPEWKLIFAGDGEIKEASHLAHNLKIRNQIEFKGWISGKEKDLLLKKTSFFCLASYAEGFPMSVIEAWAYGLPVVSTPVGGLKDILIDEYNALIFQPGNIEQLASKLDRIIADVSLRRNIANRSYLLFATTFKFENICQQMDDLYQHI